LVKSVENDEWISKGRIDSRKKELQKYLSDQKKKAISIKIPENDVHAGLFGHCFTKYLLYFKLFSFIN